MVAMIEMNFTCAECGAKQDYTPLILEGKERFKPRLCASCLAGETEARQRAAREARRAELKAIWSRICPEAYRQTDPNFPLMRRDILNGLMAYDPKSGRGVGLYGPTGQRKTRMMFLLAEKLHMEEHRVFACSSKRIAGCFAVKYGKDRSSSEARDVIRRCYKADILFLDDLGKQRFSPAGESEFFDLVEGRTSKLKPILWTANATGDELAAMMSPDKGGPIVRRLEDFCEVIGV